MTTHRYLLGTFSNENDVLHAVTEARRSGLDVDDVYTPYAVHGLDRAMGLRPSRLTWVCFLGGFLGVALMLYFEFWTSAQDWPLNVGGKPYNSLPAVIPIAFEATVLFAGMSVVIALFIRCRLWPDPATGASRTSRWRGVAEARWKTELGPGTTRPRPRPR